MGKGFNSFENDRIKFIENETEKRVKREVERK